MLEMLRDLVAVIGLSVRSCFGDTAACHRRPTSFCG
jgi:hypothetical protein